MTASEAMKFAPKIKEVLSLAPERAFQPLVVWLYGQSLCGKSLIAEWVKRICRTTAHWQGLEKDSRFWNGYMQQDVLVLDEAREHTLPFETFLRLANNAPYQVEVKNGSASVTSPLIVITSPIPPWNFWSDSVDERGHPKDIMQVMNRLSFVVNIVPAKHTGFKLSRPQPWEKPPTMHVKQTNLFEEDKDTLSKELSRYESSKDVQILQHWAYLPETPTTICALLSPHKQWCAIPLIRTTLTLPGKDMSAPDTSDSIHWSKRLRLPKGISTSAAARIEQSVKRDKEFAVAFYVEWRNIKDEIREELKNHYFADLFDVEESKDPDPVDAPPDHDQVYETENSADNELAEIHNADGTVAGYYDEKNKKLYD